MKSLRKGFLLGFLALTIISLSFYIFSFSIGALTEQNAEKRLMETASNNANSVRSMFDKDIRFLNGISSELVDHGDISGFAPMDFLRTITEKMEYHRIVIELPDGSSYSTDGKASELPDGDYLQQAFSGKTLLTNVYESAVERERCIALIVPIYQDDTVIGALRCEYLSSVLSQSVDLDTFDGAGYFNLTDSQGNLLFQTNNIRNAYHGENMLSAMQSVDFRPGYSQERIAQDMAAGKTGYTIYTLSDVERHVYYKPIGLNDWYILCVVPSEYLQLQKNSIDFSAILLLVAILVVFSALILFIFLQGRKNRLRIENDRDYFEKIINNIHLPIFIADSLKNIEFINDSALHFFNRGKDELIGKPCVNCGTVNCGTPNCAIELMKRTGKNNSILEDGKNHYMVSTSLLDDGRHRGNDSSFIEVIQDITEIVEMQKILEEKTLELETISENLTGGILITTLENGFPIISCNQGYCDLISDTEENCIGKLALENVVQESRSETENQIFDQLQNNGIVSLEHELLKKGGHKIWVSLYGKQAVLHGKQIGVWMMRDISDRMYAEQELKISEERYRIAEQNTEDVILDYNIQEKIMIHTEKAQEIYGVPEVVENAPEALVKTGIIGDAYVEEFLKMFEKIRSGEPKATCIITSNTADGRYLWNRLSFTTIFDNEGTPIRAVGILQDITSEQEAKRQYEREAQYREVMMKDAALYYEANLSKHIFVTGHERIVANYSDTPINDHEAVVKLLLKNMVYAPDRDLVYSHIGWEALMKAYQDGHRKIMFEYRRKLNTTNEPAWVECTLYFLEDEETQEIKILCYIKDINEAKTRELSLQQKAERDLLTGLYNKVTTESIVKEYLAQDAGQAGTFLLIDLDNFKMVNDTLGHSFGDAVLSEVSQKIQALFHSTDIVGRIGGDEFAVFMPGVNSRRNACSKAEKICEMFHNAYTGTYNNYKISGSVGIALSPEHGVAFQELYQKSDTALYFSKNNGKDTYSLYDDTLPKLNLDSAVREIDTNSGKVFSENIIEYVIRIFYEASNPERVVNAVLELISKHFQFERGFLLERLVDGHCWRNTFEWCADGVAARQNELQSIPYYNPEKYFDQKDCMIVSDMSQLAVELRELTDPKVQSLVQFVIRHKGVIRAIIGFDRYDTISVPSEEQISILQVLTMLLGPYLINYREAALPQEDLE